jgi:prophage regulatory protein
MTAPSPKLIRRREVAARLGVSLATLDRLTARGDLPRAVQISPRRVGYFEHQIDEWLRARAEGLSVAA